MAGPWENYQAPGAAQPASGPWLRYQSPAGTPGGYTPATDPADIFRAQQPQATAGFTPVNGIGTETSPPPNMWDWWQQAHGNEEPPNDPRQILTRWALEAPDQAIAFNNWHIQNYGVPFVTFGERSPGAYRAASPSDALSMWIRDNQGRPLSAITNWLTENTPGNPMPVGQMAWRTFANGATLGNSANILNLLGASDEAVNRQEQAVQGFHLQHPEAAGTLELAGGAIPFMLPGGAARLAGASARGVTAAETAGGVLGGAAAGYGYADPNASPWDIAASIGLNAALGGIAARAGARSAENVHPIQATPAAPIIRAVEPADNLTQGLNRSFGLPEVPQVVPEGQPYARNVSQGDAYARASQSLYQDLANSGLYVTANSFDNFANRLTIDGTAIADFASLRGQITSGFEGVDRVMNRIAAMEKNTLSYMDLESLRQFISAEIRSSTNENEVRMLAQLRNQLSNYVDGLSGGDFMTAAGGANMTPQQAQEAAQMARENWRIHEQFDILDTAVANATASAGDQMAALRNEIRKIVRAENRNPTHTFSAEQLDLMTQIAQGANRNVWTRFVNSLGGVAPRGLAVIAGLTGTAISGNALPLLPILAGGAARKFTSDQTRNLFGQLYGGLGSQLVPYAPSAWQAVGGGAGAGIFGFPTTPPQGP